MYGWDFQSRRILSWKPGEPATREDEEDWVLRTTGINDLWDVCRLSISSSGELFVLDWSNRRLLRFQDGHGHVVLDDLDADDVVCSPNGVVYLRFLGDRPGQLVQKLVGSTLQTVIASEGLSEDLFSEGGKIFVTREEVVYFMHKSKGRILRVNPAESSEPVVVGCLSKPNWITGLFVTEGGAIYASDWDDMKVWAFCPGDTAPIEVLRCPDPLKPGAILVQDKSLYVSMEADTFERLAPQGVYEYSLPPEFQFE